jgi:hypothetical protein
MAPAATALITLGNNSGTSGFGVVTLDGSTLRWTSPPPAQMPGAVHPLHINGTAADAVAALGRCALKVAVWDDVELAALAELLVRAGEGTEEP